MYVQGVKFFSLSLVFVLLGTGCLMSADKPAISDWHEPLGRTQEREQKLTFGLYVTPDPENNPIDPPERFTGYHTALDFEIFPEEANQDVPVFAVCEGEIIYKNEVSGYGGVLVQECTWEDQIVTVLYGHLDIDSVGPHLGGQLRPGEVIGNLGAGRSEETSFTRKHLHLGVHKGSVLELRGYVQDNSELEAYLDPAMFFNS